jgi:ubiquinone/menaquinone biosynthesis C-methylase UbiE
MACRVYVDSLWRNLFSLFCLSVSAFSIFTAVYKNHFEFDKRNALQSKEYAQWIAFAPMIFQSSRILRDSGILANIKEAGAEGASYDELCTSIALSPYAVRVLLEAGLGIELLTFKNERYIISNAGLFILDDAMTKANMDFTNDICYQGLHLLEDSLKSGKPEGLKFLGPWPTIYEGLSSLPEQLKTSWFNFDHFYSDSAFTISLQKVLSDKPKKLLDIGGNTGKWAVHCMSSDPEILITIFDLPGQANMAKQTIKAHGFDTRTTFIERNILTDKFDVKEKFDAIWMSQFLDCFSDEQIKYILTSCRGALAPDGCIYILETFWDRQRFKASAFCLQMTSLYFTGLANGNSQMYDSKVFFKLIEESGLEIAEVSDNFGLSHTLLKCKVKK